MNNSGSDAIFIFNTSCTGSIQCINDDSGKPSSLHWRQKPVAAGPGRRSRTLPAFRLKLNYTFPVLWRADGRLWGFLASKIAPATSYINLHIDLCISYSCLSGEPRRIQEALTALKKRYIQEEGKDLSSRPDGGGGGALNLT